MVTSDVPPTSARDRAANSLQARLRTAELKNAVSEGVIAALRAELHHAQAMIAATARDCTIASIGVTPETDKLKRLGVDRPEDDAKLHKAKPEPYEPGADTELDALREEVVSLAQRLQASELRKENCELNWEEAVQKNGHLQMAATLLKEQLQLARNALDATNSDLRQFKAEADHLRGELATSVSKAEAEELKAETSRLRDELAASTSQKQLLESKLDFLGRDIGHLRSTNADLKSRLEATESSSDSINAQLKATVAENERLKAEQDKLNRELGLLRSSNQESSAKLEADEGKARSPANVSGVQRQGVTAGAGLSSLLPRTVKHAADSYHDSVNRVREFSRRLDDHHLAFYRSNKWVRSNPERNHLDPVCLRILSEELQWHVNFVYELLDELLTLQVPSPMPISSTFEQFRQEVARVSDAAVHFTVLSVASSSASPRELVEFIWMVHRISKNSTVKVPRLLERHVADQRAKQVQSAGAR